jgi:hypothetical protein
MTNKQLQNPGLLLALTLTSALAAGGACGRGVLTAPDDGADGGATRTCVLTGPDGDAGGSGGAGMTGAGGFDGRGCPCSRRPGENNSFMCPRGAGATASAVIGPGGGTLLLGGTPSTLGLDFQLYVPPGALAETVVISVTEAALPPPAPYVDYSPIYDLQPAGLTSSAPMTVTVPWMNVDGIVPRELAIYQSTQDCGISYTRVADSGQNAGFNEGSLSILGPVFMGYPRDAAVDLACGCAPDAGASPGCGP